MVPGVIAGLFADRQLPQIMYRRILEIAESRVQNTDLGMCSFAEWKEFCDVEYGFPDTPTSDISCLDAHMLADAIEEGAERQLEDPEDRDEETADEQLTPTTNTIFALPSRPRKAVREEQAQTDPSRITSTSMSDVVDILDRQAQAYEDQLDNLHASLNTSLQRAQQQTYQMLSAEIESQVNQARHDSEAATRELRTILTGMIRELEGLQ